MKKIYKNGSFILVSGVIFSSIDLEPFEFNPTSEFTPTGYKICNQLTNHCTEIGYLPKTKTIVLTDNSFCQLSQNPQSFIDDVAVALNMDNKQSIREIAKFFEDKTILVQQGGVEGYLYKVGTFAQTAGTASMVARTISLAQAAGVSGIKILRAQPLMLVAVPTVGAMFFHGCGTLIGNNTVGRTCNTIGNILNLPMFFCELVYNGYVSPVINQTIGISTVLNYTKQMKRGPGLDTMEAIQMLKYSKKDSLIKILKCWIIQKLGGKC
jgi:hypothetical protein